jgi:hypothetical protein
MQRNATVLLVSIVIIMAFNTDRSIKTDGVIEPGEWSGAVEYELGNGNKLLLKKDQGELCIGLAGEQYFWAHAYLSDDRSTTVMHASAALDEITYQRKGEIWLTEDTFQYELRDSLYNAATEKKMNDFFETHGWVANNINFGDKKTMEFRISLKDWASPTYLACVVANFDMSFHSFPAGLNDHTRLPRLVQGYSPDSLVFDVTMWMKVH